MCDINLFLKMLFYFGSGSLGLIANTVLGSISSSIENITENINMLLADEEKIGDRTKGHIFNMSASIYWEK